MLLRRRLMGFLSWQSIAVLLAAASPARSAQAEEARAAVRAALEQEATAPSLPPAFPSRSRKETDPNRMARDQSGASANGAAAAAKSEAAARSAQGAAAPTATQPPGRSAPIRPARSHTVRAGTRQLLQAPPGSTR